MSDKEIGEKIYKLDLGNFNWKIRLFESNTKKNWWRGELNFNQIKYNIFDTINNKLYNINNI